MENHHFNWENPLFQWPFSIAILTKPEGMLTPQWIDAHLPKNRPPSSTVELQLLTTEPMSVSESGVYHGIPVYPHQSILICGENDDKHLDLDIR